MKYPQIFIEEMYTAGGSSRCSLCKCPAIKSMCKKHLNYMAQRFRYWVKKRYRIGKCYQCDKRRVRGEQRCDRHKEINRKRCLDWSNANRGYLLSRYAILRRLGICVNSPKHGKAFGVHNVCKKCFRARKSRWQDKANHD